MTRRGLKTTTRHYFQTTIAVRYSLLANQGGRSASASADAAAFVRDDTAVLLSHHSAANRGHFEDQYPPEVRELHCAGSEQLAICFALSITILPDEERYLGACFNLEHNRKVEPMTQLLSAAFARAAQLTEKEQDEFARLMLAELDAEHRWSELFARPESEDLLERLAGEALEAHRAGHTLPLRTEDL